MTLGKHELQFLFAPMVHWPEVMLTYDSYEKVLFSADAFGKFGALDVRKIGTMRHVATISVLSENTEMQVQNVLKAAQNFGYSDDLSAAWTCFERKSFTLYRKIQYMVFV